MKIFSTAKQVTTLLLAVLASSATASLAAIQQGTPTPRITAPIDNASRATLTGSLMPRAIPANDVGAMPATTPLQGITLLFNRTPAQQSALDALIAAQQNPTSPLYHQWLTPAQFGAQFGLAPSDLAAVQTWLQQQGFTIQSISNSRDQIRFSGTEAQVESAFGAPIHYFKSGTETHFAPATALSVPAAIASTVLAVGNLSDFHPHSQVVLHTPIDAKPNFTSSQTGSVFLDPKDLETFYDVTAAYNSGYTGAGQTIVIVGQSAVVTTDVTNFQSALGLTAKAPTLLLMPGTGASAINPLSSGDELESDLDLEYSSALAPGATVEFVYTGNSGNYGAFDAMTYAIDQKLGQIVSASYGDCETDLGNIYYAQYNAPLQQAAAQGQTVISAAGDTGSTDCSGITTLSTTQQEALAVDFPASSQYVTAMGGTEIPTANLTSTYFTTASGSDVVSSVKSYIPEQVWNDDSSQYGLASGGGGTSVITARPSWQTGVPGIPAGSFRLVPDISLDASPDNAPLLFCSSDPASNVNGSCSHGFRDINNQYLTVAGGTSFDAPTFAGMLALINQAKGYGTGQGVINPTLYTLASNATTYSNVFHDITVGSNDCLAGFSYCSTASTTEYPATTGYDEASGLGSIDLDKLLVAWPASTVVVTTTPSTTTLTAATLTPNANTNDAVTITVASASTTVTTTPTGTVTISVDGATIGSYPLVNGVATYTFNSAVYGAHTIVAAYSGDLVYTASTGTLLVTVPAFTLSVPNQTIAPGASDTFAATVTPLGGYTGTVLLETLTGTNSASAGLLNSTAFCYDAPTASAVITGTAAVSTNINFYTSEATCVSLGLTSPTHGQGSGLIRRAGTLHASNQSKPSPWRSAPLPLAFAGLLAIGCFRRRSRLLRGVLALGVAGLLCCTGLGLTGCSSSASGAQVTAPAGTYSFVLFAQDSNNSNINASTTFTLTIP